MKFQTINPATEEVIDEFDMIATEDALTVVGELHEGFKAWKKQSLKERARRFRALADVLRNDLEYHARLITREMGKPIRQSRAEVEKCAWCAEVYAQMGPGWLAEEILQADGKSHRLCYEPLGVILAVMPWNFPYWQVIRFAAPSILAGNVTLLKHANNVSQCALAIENAFQEAGFSENVFRAVMADHETVGELIASDLIAGVSLTGSTRAGAHVGAAAGGAIKKVVLELGGSDPFIVLENSDIALAAKNANWGRMMNAGQSCIAAKRFIVRKEIAREFTRAFAEHAEKMIVGDPMDEATEMGPLVNQKGREEIERQVREAVDSGAKIVTGGMRLERKGYFYLPTILTSTTADMACRREELFGPVAVVVEVVSDEEAVAIANDSEFGLGGSVWTKDIERGERIARQLEAGTVFVNSIVKSDPRLPFGGIKKSGIGRELAHLGMREFVNIKSLNIYDQ